MFQVYKFFIEAVDAIDNGVAQYDAAGPPRCAAIRTGRVHDRSHSVLLIVNDA